MIPEQLLEAAAEVHGDAGMVSHTTVRTLLSWFQAKRRGFRIVREIRKALDSLELATFPDFESAYIDGWLRFIPSATSEQQTIELSGTADGESSATATVTLVEPEVAGPSYVSGAVDDPTFRVGQLDAANRNPIHVRPDADLSRATTLMLLHDFSQLPVMQSEREVKGVVSWRSIGKHTALGRPCTFVRDCMESPAPEVPSIYSLFSVIGLIVEHGYVLVRQADRRISGIVTTSDLSLQFRQLAEPFLLVGEIENYVRRLIDGRFTVDQLVSVRDPDDQRSIESVADLTFGEYVRLLENPNHWANLGLLIDRGVFISRLDQVRELRNDVMHFNPDPFAPEDLETLRSFVVFMRELIAYRRADSI